MTRREAAGTFLKLIVGPGLYLGAMAVAGCGRSESAITDPKSAEIVSNRLKRLSGGEDDRSAAEQTKGKGKGRARPRGK